MNTLAQIGMEAKDLLYDMRAAEASDKLLSASLKMTDDSSIAEKELVDWYAFYALAIIEARLPQEITHSERDYLDTSLDRYTEINGRLDEKLGKIISWFSKIESLRDSPKISRPIRNPKSKSAQNRLVELKADLDKQLNCELSSVEWKSTIALLEEQLKHVMGWRVSGRSVSLVWTTVKPGLYSEYVKLLLERKDFETVIKQIRDLVLEMGEIEENRDKITCKTLGYNYKSSSIAAQIDRLLCNFASRS